MTQNVTFLVTWKELDDHIQPPMTPKIIDAVMHYGEQ